MGDRRLQNIAGSEHIGLHRFKREKLAARHLLQRSGAEHVIDASHHAVNRLPVPDIADVKFDFGVLQLVPHVVLLFFVTRKNADLPDLAVEKTPQYGVAETAGAAGNQQNFVFE